MQPGPASQRAAEPQPAAKPFEPHLDAANADAQARRAATCRHCIDAHDVVRSGRRKVLEAHHGWEVVGEAANGKEAIDKAVETVPDVAILDYSMQLVNGIEAARQIRERLPKTEVLIFTMYDNETVVEQLLRAGARLRSQGRCQGCADQGR